MKLYIFTLDHLSTVQKGIQAAHVVAELMLKGRKEIEEWAKHDKTIVMLQGGNYLHLKYIEEAIANSQFTGASFREDEETLGALVTATAVLLPSEKFNVDEYLQLDENSKKVLSLSTNAKKVNV